MSNSAAEKTYNLIVQEGARLGCSVGCMVTEWSWIDEEDKWNSGISIDHVHLLELSVVGIPANQRCWVENAVKGIFARSLVEGDGDTALSLAPAFRGLFSKQYEDVARNVTSDGLRKSLSVCQEKQRLIVSSTTSPTPPKAFALVGAKGTKKSLSREEVGAYIEKSMRSEKPSNVTDSRRRKRWTAKKPGYPMSPKKTQRKP
jgi:hypothetical protein